MNENSSSKESDSRFPILAFVTIGSLAAAKYQAPAFAAWEAYKAQILIGLTGLSLCGLGILINRFWMWHLEVAYQRSVIAFDPESVLLGHDEKGSTVYLKDSSRTSHTQVIGTTSAGKSESVILPWAIHDIERGNGLLIIDGKSDSSFLSKLYAYVVKSGRQKDFHLFSLANTAPSSTFNPLYGESPEVVTERVFSSFPVSNDYYKAVQFKVFLTLVRLLFALNVVPTFRILQLLLTDMNELEIWAGKCDDPDIVKQVHTFISEPERERSEKVSGLDAYLSHFASGALAPLFNSNDPDIQLDRALKQNQICYFQLPTMYYPFLAEATGKLLLQAFQNAAAKRHLDTSRGVFFSCFLDDFQDYIYPGFAALLNKSRSANIGVVFSHQALGDLEKVSPAFANTVMTCTNVKIVMRNNDPDTCEHFAKTFGTEDSEKSTERRKSTFLGETNTGEASVREVKQYRFHPDLLKNLSVGQAIVSIPHFKGVTTTKVNFQRRMDLPDVPLSAKSKLELPAPLPMQILNKI